MKERTKGFISGVIVSVLLVLLASGVYAASQIIEISPIKVMVNGQEFHPKDAGGKDVLVFVYNGTTYAPLRALAETFGLEVGYDSNAKMATVTMPSANVPAEPVYDEPVREIPVESSGSRIYITKTEKHYHHDPSCNGGTYYESTLEEAQRRGLTPCDKCVH